LHPQLHPQPFLNLLISDEKPPLECPAPRRIKRNRELLCYLNNRSISLQRDQCHRTHLEQLSANMELSRNRHRKLLCQERLLHRYQRLRLVSCSLRLVDLQ
jgi:hypothetical protein